jgi:putative transposase
MSRNKFELKTSGEQQRLLRCFAGSCQFAFNKTLALQKDRYEQDENKLGYAGLCRQLTGWHSSKDLEQAYANFFAKRADFPRFKNKGQSDSFRYPNPKQIKLDLVNRRIFLKLGWIRYLNSQENSHITLSCRDYLS